MDNLITGIQITLLGMASVFLILLVLYLALHAMRFAFHTQQEESTKSRSQPAAQESEADTQEQGGTEVDPKVLAAIAGALAAYQEGASPAGLLQIRQKAGPANLAWRQAARLETTHRWRH
ncbi:MAG: OadG family transporter subunit [Desulfohalobiaceae bacterium]